MTAATKVLGLRLRPETIEALEDLAKAKGTTVKGLVEDIASTTTEQEGEPVTSDTDTETRLIHFLEDGFTCFGQVRRKGEEVTITSTMYAETLDPDTSTSWADLDEEGQRAKWGRPMFTDGPTPAPPATGSPSDRGRQSPTGLNHPDPAVRALHLEWQHEDQLRQAGTKVRIQSRTVHGPRP